MVTPIFFKFYQTRSVYKSWNYSARWKQHIAVHVLTRAKKSRGTKNFISLKHIANMPDLRQEHILQTLSVFAF